MNPLVLLVAQSPAVAAVAGVALACAVVLATGVRPPRRRSVSPVLPEAAADPQAVRARLLGRVGRAAGSFAGEEGAVVLDGVAHPARLEAGTVPPAPGAALRVTGIGAQGLRVRLAGDPPDPAAGAAA